MKKKVQGFFTVKFPDGRPGGQVGVHHRFLFPNGKLFNDFGSIESILEKELNSHKKYIEWFGESVSGVEIIIRDFRMDTTDQCSSNQTEVVLKADVFIKSGTNESKLKNPILEFNFRDEIQSKVTTCWITGMSLSIAGLFWYIPYLGFRGSRQDQLNQLGLIALQNFFSKLEVSAKNLSSGIEKK